MGRDWRARFRKELGGLNLSAYSRDTGIPLRTLQDWKAGRRNPPPDAATRLVAYLRSQSQALATAARRLEAVATDQPGESDE
jgi:DNA-binding transcriptional regulator YiaG